MINKLLELLIRFIVVTILIVIFIFIFKLPFYFDVILFFLLWILLLCYRVYKAYELAIIVLFSYISVLFLTGYLIGDELILTDVLFLPDGINGALGEKTKFVFSFLNICFILFTFEWITNKHIELIINDELFKSRSKDLEKIKLEIRHNQILGINSEWGNGKSLIINHLISDTDMINSYDFIKIDILSMNLDQLIDYLLQQIDKSLKNQGIYTLTSKYLNGYINNSYYGRILSKVLNMEDSYSSIIEELSKDISQLERSIIVIYEDLDRIDDLALLRKIFYISEKLASNKNSKIKFIYQYNSIELNKRGLDNRFLQKYIPQNIRLTHLSFEDIWNSLLESKPDKYKELKKWTRKIIGFAEVPLYYISNPEEFSRDLELAEFKRENYTVRNIELFMNLLISNISIIKESELLIKVLYIKIFCPEFYNNISTYKNLNDNFQISLNDDLIMLSKELIMNDISGFNRCVISYSSHNLLTSCSYSNKRLNFQTLISYSILNIYRLEYLKNTNEMNIHSQNNEEFVKYKKFELELYYLIESGLNRYDEYHKLGNLLSQKIEKIDSSDEFELVLNNMRWKGLPSSDSFDGCLKTLGMGKWNICFLAFRDLECSFEKYSFYHSKLIKIFFNCIKPNDNIEDIFSVLNIFVSNSRIHLMQKQFIYLLKNFSNLDIDKCNPIEEYQLFVQYIYDILVSFSYIDNLAIQKEQFKNLDINMSKEINNYLDNLANQLTINNTNKSLDVSRYIDSIDTIKKAISLIAHINICNISVGEINGISDKAIESNEVNSINQNEVDNMTYSVKDIISILNDNSV